MRIKLQGHGDFRLHGPAIELSGGTDQIAVDQAGGPTLVVRSWPLSAAPAVGLHLQPVLPILLQGDVGQGFDRQLALAQGLAHLLHLLTGLSGQLLRAVLYAGQQQIERC